MHDRLDLAAVLFEQLGDRMRITDVDVVMFVAADVLDQTVPRLFGRGFRAEELRAHVVVDSNHVRTLVCEVLHRFRADQSGRTCDDERAHHVDVSANRAAESFPDNPGQLACGWVHSRSWVLRIAA